MSIEDLLETIEVLLPDARRARRQHNQFHPYIKASEDLNKALATLHSPDFGLSIKEIAAKTGLSYHSVRDRLITAGAITPKPHPKEVL